MAKPKPEGEVADAKAEEKRLTISPTFDPETYNKIVELARDDERSPAQYLARFVRQNLPK
jgi:hypothetical protein